MSHAVIVVNRRAGAGAAAVDGLSKRLCERLRELRTTTKLLDLGAASGRSAPWQPELQRAITDEHTRVFVLGGDGTVLAVATKLIGHTAPLAVIPLGTANLLARDLGIPLQPEAAIDRLASGTDIAPRRIDVGDVNGHLFLCASMIGLTTTLARTREAARGQNPILAALRLLRKTALLLRQYPYRRIRLVVEDNPLQIKTRAMVVTNNPISHAVLPYPTRARLDTGLLALYAVRKGPLWELPRLALRLLQGYWDDDPRIFHRHAPSLRLQTRHARSLTVMNDGERLKITTPLHYRCRPAALAVLAPKTNANAR